MLREMSWEQFLGWLAYCQVEPFGDQRGDLQAGVIASAVVNQITIANSAKPVPRDMLTKPSDFMLFLERKEQDSEPTTESKWKSFKARLLREAKTTS